QPGRDRPRRRRLPDPAGGARRPPRPVTGGGVAAVRAAASCVLHLLAVRVGVREPVGSESRVVRRPFFPSPPARGERGEEGGARIEAMTHRIAVFGGVYSNHLALAAAVADA